VTQAWYLLESLNVITLLLCLGRECTLDHCDLRLESGGIICNSDTQLMRLESGVHHGTERRISTKGMMMGFHHDIKKCTNKRLGVVYGEVMFT